MSVLIGIALKSLVISGLALGLLKLMTHRSAAERSWVAHVGLLALVVIAFAPLVVTWNVETPAFLVPAPETATPAQVDRTPAISARAADVARIQAQPAAPTSATKSSRGFSISPVAATSALYSIPAVVLLLITFLAILRLVALRARADVLVDGHWLTALARAQQRMGFKHGTALLTSNALASPISWGLMRPVILLNGRAVEASGEAEAIIAHELAHVARMDWIKLLLARVATALFWFNPLVWMLAREAHQLREEAADDAVLAADIDDTDYAQLLVGVARHECPGLLLGAHGVAPSRSSLARRVARVLDAKTVRGPAARSFGFGVFVGALVVAAPLAALTLTPKQTAETKEGLATSKVDTSRPYYQPAQPAADLPHILVQGVSTSVSTAAAAVGQARYDADEAEDAADAAQDAADRAQDAREAALERASEARDRAIEQAQASAERAREQAEKYRDKNYAMRAVGVTPEYIAGIRSAAPHLAHADPNRFVEMKAVGVTPGYVAELANAGLPRLSMDQLVEARAIGLNGSYVRGAIAAGARADLEGLVELRTLGISPSQIARARAAGAVTNSQIIERAMGIPGDVHVTGPKFKGWPFEGARPPAAPRPPQPPEVDADDG
jgi:beta-lactamase regulating signal transducer with metallopeptidase domain